MRGADARTTAIGVSSVVKALAAPILAAVLAGCASDGVGTPPELSVRGRLDYPARVATQAGAQAVVELREAGAADARVLARTARPVDGAQVPTPFELRVPGARTVPGRGYALRAGVTVDGQPAWASEPVTVSATAGEVDVGTLRLAPVRPIAFASTLRCGERVATLGVLHGRWTLVVDGREIALREVGASGSGRWVADGDPRTTVRTAGPRAHLTVDGTAWPECASTPAGAGASPLRLPFAARGNEPSWRLAIDPTRIRFQPAPDAAPVEAPTPASRAAGAGRRWDADAPGGRLAIVVLERVCEDTMSGMPHPASVAVDWGGRRFAGCGGEPAGLLRGPEWVVEDIDRGGIVDRSRATLAFAPDGRIVGRASCNDYTGRWTLDGESLRIAGLATASRTCAPALMRQEARLVERLHAVRRFAIAPDGALVLHDDRDGRIVARR